MDECESICQRVFGYRLADKPPSGCKSRRTDLPERAQYLQKQIFAKPPSQSRRCNSGRAVLAGQYEQASLYPEGCVREAELADPGQTVIHFGKMKDKKIAEVWKTGPAGQGWVRWAASTDGKGYDPQGKPEGIHLQRMARAFLSLQSAYAG